MLIHKDDQCALCGINNVHLSAHHIDYGQPLRVYWLCDRCHGLVHHEAHPLNPKNNKQTPRDPYLEGNDHIGVTCYIPIANFIALKANSEEKKQPLSKVLRDLIIKEYPTDNGQFEFNFEVTDGNTRQIQNENIQSLEKDNPDDDRSVIQRLQVLRSKGDNDMSRVENICEILAGHGGPTSELQYADIV